MLRDVVAVQPLPEYRFHVTFDDGTQGVVDVREMVPFAGVFQPLQDACVLFSRESQHRTRYGVLAERCRPRFRCAVCDSDWRTSSGVPHRKEMIDGPPGDCCRNSVSASTRRSRETLSKTVSSSVIASDIALAESAIGCKRQRWTEKRRRR